VLGVLPAFIGGREAGCGGGGVTEVPLVLSGVLKVGIHTLPPQDIHLRHVEVDQDLDALEGARLARGVLNFEHEMGTAPVGIEDLELFSVDASLGELFPKDLDVVFESFVLVRVPFGSNTGSTSGGSRTGGVVVIVMAGHATLYTNSLLDGGHAAFAAFGGVGDVGPALSTSRAVVQVMLALGGLGLLDGDVCIHLRFCTEHTLHGGVLLAELEKVVLVLAGVAPVSTGIPSGIPGRNPAGVLAPALRTLHWGPRRG
jgi:hypothetical protein